MTATATTLSAPSTIPSRHALWTRVALLSGGALLGITATLVIRDGDDAPARSATNVEASFRDASATQADQYIDMLEGRAVSVPAAEAHLSPDAAERWAADDDPYAQPGAYAHGFSYAALETCTQVISGPC